MDNNSIKFLDLEGEELDKVYNFIIKGENCVDPQLFKKQLNDLGLNGLDKNYIFYLKNAVNYNSVKSQNFLLRFHNFIIQNNFVLSLYLIINISLLVGAVLSSVLLFSAEYYIYCIFSVFAIFVFANVIRLFLKTLEKLSDLKYTSRYLSFYKGDLPEDIKINAIKLKQLFPFVDLILEHIPNNPEAPKLLVARIKDIENNTQDYYIGSGYKVGSWQETEFITPQIPRKTYSDLTY